MDIVTGVGSPTIDGQRAWVVSYIQMQGEALLKSQKQINGWNLNDNNNNNNNNKEEKKKINKTKTKQKRKQQKKKKEN